MYPKNDYETLESPNPYVLHVEDSLSEKHTIINKNPNTKGVIELFIFLLKTDIFFFNWIEDVSVKKYGKIQAVLFPVFLFLAKMLRKKIIWVLHNIYSHEKSNRRWIHFGFKLMIKYSDLIITHSGSGIDFVKENFSRHAYKVKYIIHPVENLLPNNIETEKKYDFLIWGTIHPYKGVIEFLEFAKHSPELKNAKILISGICPHKDLRKQLDSYLNENIKHVDGFLDIEEITEMAAKSKFVLFTYNSESILSSGSLMDSIRMGAIIIGPEKGAFRDLKPYSFIQTYKTREEIAQIFKNLKIDNKACYQEIETFCHQNSWKLYGEKLFSVSDGIL